MNSISSDRTVLWTRGNRPTQILLEADSFSTQLHLKALYLLADRILGAASYYFESAITRDLLDGAASPLIERQELLLYASEEVSGFADHGLSKVRKNNDQFHAYSDRRRVLEMGLNLDRRTPLVLRPPADISARIEELWLRDLDSTDRGSLGWVAASTDAENANYFRAQMRTSVVNRAGDLVWENIAGGLRAAGLPQRSLHACRLRLLQLYNEAAAAAVISVSDTPRQLRHDALDAASSNFDTDLLLGCLKALDLLNVFARLSFVDIIGLKQSVGWGVFHGVYLELLSYAADGSAVQNLPLLREVSEHANSAYGTALSRDEFVTAFRDMISLTGADRNLPKSEGFADRLYRVAERFGETPFALLQQALLRSSTIVPTPSRMEHAMHSADLQAFIVHGSDTSAVWELKDYLQNILGFSEPIVLLQRPNSGRSIIEKFEEEGDRVDVVFVILTPDDPSRDGGMQARQNVLFELGYFAAKLGRKSGRVIILRRGDVEIPTDLSGVVYVDISRSIASAGEEIRRELPKTRFAG